MTSPAAKSLRPLLYNPLRQDPDDLERLFVARRPTFERIFAEITSQRNDAVPQHELILGQRGMGKTTMLARLAVELRKSPHSDRFIALSFWEEQHIEVDRLSVFWLNCLDSLADAIAKTEGEAKAQQLDAVIDRVRRISPEEDCARAARDAFAQAISESGRRPVLLIDNFNLLLARLKKHDHILRGFFTKHGAPIIVGAAITPPEEISGYDAAFYDGFKTTLLHRLTLDEVKEMIGHMAKQLRQEDQVSQHLARHLARLAALRDLSGGNPRTTLLIYRLCAQGFSNDVHRDLEILLDESTPLYQSRFDQLSEQGQKLVARLARHWRPATAETITELTGFPRGTVSPLLGRLEDEGIIEKAQMFDPDRQDQPKGKRGGLSKRIGYQLAERFFNIWLLMRTASRRERAAGVDCLARFIETMYSREERGAYARQMVQASKFSWNEALMACALSRTLDDSSASHRHDLRTRAESAFLELTQGRKEKLAEVIDPSEIQPKVLEFHEIRQRLEALVPGDARTSPKEFADLVLGSVSMVMPGNPNRWSIAASTAPSANKLDTFAERLRVEFREQSDEVGKVAMEWLKDRLLSCQFTSVENHDEFEAAFADAPNAGAFYVLGAITQQSLPDHAERACRKAVQIDENYWQAWQLLAILAHKKMEWLAAETAYQHAYDLNQEYVPLLCGYAALLAGPLKRPKDAEPILRQAKELAPRDPSVAMLLGATLSKQSSRADEAITEFRRAGALDLSDPRPWIYIGEAFELLKKDYAAAETNYRKAISMLADAGHVRTKLAHLLQDRRGQIDEAESIYRRVIADEQSEGSTWTGLGNLLCQHRHKFEEAAICYRTAIKDFKDSYGWAMLGTMRMNHLQDFAGAEAALRSAIEMDLKNDTALINLGILLARLGSRDSEALSYMNQATILAPEKAGHWNSIGNLKFDSLADLDGAEDAFRKALELDSNDDSPRHNLAFLLRDYRGKMDAAREVLSELKQPDRWKDSQALHQALFAAYEDNWGHVTDALRKALCETGGNGLPMNTQDDWFRASAVLLHLGFGQKLLTFLREGGWDMRLMPWYSALEAHLVGDKQMLLNIPAEARDAAGKVFDEINRRRAKLPQRPR